MSTATVTYGVSAGQVSQIKSAVLDIQYIDQNGVLQHISGYSAPAGSWTLTFTGTVGNPYFISAREIQGGNAPESVGQPVTVTVTDSNGSVSRTANNFSNTSINAGLDGTI